MILIGNRSSEPALYGTTILAFDPALNTPEKYDKFEVLGVKYVRAGEAEMLRAYRRKFNVPHHLPIFKEEEWEWMVTTIVVPPNSDFSCLYKIACPGFSVTRTGRVRRGVEPTVDIDWID